VGRGGRADYTRLNRMADVFNIRKRSDVMSRIRSSGNKDTELALIRLFRKEGITGWRRRWPLIGKPDFVFRKARLAIFVDGCFWHGCLKHSRPPQSNQAYWRAKMIRNKTRDRSVSQALRKKGWRVLRIWEHELARKNEARLVRRIRRELL
jgi:DNA mismatch endonuclease, patch repair protein